jgi:hypothetical protein
LSHFGEFEGVAMWSSRKMIMIGTAVIAAGAAWHVEAQESAASGAGIATVFDHTKLDASFANALAKGARGRIHVLQRLRG